MAKYNQQINDRIRDYVKKFTQVFYGRTYILWGRFGYRFEQNSNFDCSLKSGKTEKIIGLGEKYNER